MFSLEAVKFRRSARHMFLEVARPMIVPSAPQFDSRNKSLESWDGDESGAILAPRPQGEHF